MTYPRHRKEHRENALKAARNGGAKINLPSKQQLKEDIRSGAITHTLNEADQRSNSAKRRDFELDNQVELSPKKLKDIKRWSKDPAHSDIRGVDCKKEAFEVENKRGYSGRASGKREVEAALGEDEDLFDPEAHTDSSLTASENAAEIRRKLRPTGKNLAGMI
jgi:hypothetical protein